MRIKQLNIFFFSLIALLSLIFSPTNWAAHTKQQLIIYSGITMIPPLKEIIQAFEEQYPVKVVLKQGASGYLYQTVKVEQHGDIFFPGSNAYRLQNQADGFLLEPTFVGYNRLALMVANGNPKKIKADIHELTNPELSVVLSAPQSGAVGKSTKKLLDNLKLSDKVYHNVTYFTTDSHQVFTAFKKQHADLAINWYATAIWEENTDVVDALLLPHSISKPKVLELNLLKFAQNPEMARAFQALASSEFGLTIFAKYGFLTPEELQIAIGKLKQ